MKLNFDIFGTKKRKAAKEAARLEEIRIKKEKYQERKKLISDYLNAYYEEEYKKAQKEQKKYNEIAKEANSVCPKCGSKNIINKIRRTKGEIHGEGYSHVYPSSFLLSSSYSSSSYSNLDGEVDTHPVNKCKDCGNEWAIKEPQKAAEENIFNNSFSLKPGFLYRKIRSYFSLKYDPTDIKEECNSLEEVQEKYIKDYSGMWVIKPYQRIPKYMIEYAIFDALIDDIVGWNGVHDKKTAELFGYNENDDQFSYVMPDKVWEVAKKLIKWEGEEQ